jgi:protein-tyrosine phosphatase
MHSHVLPGIDDGPDSIEGSLALARAAAAAGTDTLVATPHVSWRYHPDAATIACSVEELNRRLSAEGVELEVRAGAEIAMTRLPEIKPEELSCLGLGGSSWLLVEPPFAAAVPGLDTMVLDLQRRGHHVLLAHPERCQAFHRDRSILDSLVSAGALTSVTAGSLIGSFGREVRRFALRLVRDGLVHNVASDAHDHSERPPGIALELRQAGLDPMTEWLTCRVPAAILADADIPSGPPPPVRRRTAWWPRRAFTRQP